MRVLKRNPWLTSLGAVLSLLVLSWGRADAQIPNRATTDNTAAALVFPKVIADGTRDTLIQITNTSQMQNLVHCEYVNAAGVCRVTGGICDSNEDCPGTGPCDPIASTCQPQDFTIFLTRQQPTVWRVSTGRVNSGGHVFTQPPVECETSGVSQVCPGFGPGAGSGANVLPRHNFRGELRCFEVEATGCLVGQNALKGEAIIETLATGQISEYNAIGLPLVGDAPACTDPETLIIGTDAANGGTQYAACPTASDLNHYTERADDVVARRAAGPSCPTAGSCPVSTELTMVPCTANYLTTAGTSTTVNLVAVDEFESEVSFPQTFTCWFNRRLGQLGALGNGAFVGRATSLLKTRITPQGGRCVGGVRDGLACSQATGARGCDNGQCRPNPGILGVGEMFHTSAAAGSDIGTDAINLEMIGSRGSFDSQSNSGGCRNSNIDCSQNGDRDCCSDPTTAGPPDSGGNEQCGGAGANPGVVDPLDLCPTDSIVLPKPLP